METLDSIYLWLRPFWLLWLMALFVAIVFWVFRPKNKDDLEAHGRIPLRDDDPES